MTYRTTTAHTPAADAGATTRRHTLAVLLDPDDIVRPELRNDAILEAQRASRDTSRGPCARVDDALPGSRRWG